MHECHLLCKQDNYSTNRLIAPCMVAKNHGFITISGWSGTVRGMYHVLRTLEEGTKNR